MVLSREAVALEALRMWETSHWYVRYGLSLVMMPIVLTALYGTARIIAMGLVKWMPESALKRRLLTDAETGRLAYTPKDRA